MYNSNDIANKIKILAKSKKISLKQIFNDTGLGFNTMSNMKTSMPKADNLAKIADYLNCSVDYLLGRTSIIELNTEQPKKQNIISINSEPKPTIKTIIKPLYLTPASAGTGSWLDDNSPVEWITVPKTDDTVSADFLIKVQGDSMQPKYCNGDIVLVKRSNSITEGEFGVFILNNEAYIKKMGKGELISLNPDYENISISEYDTISCAGKVIGVLNDAE